MNRGADLEGGSMPCVHAYVRNGITGLCSIALFCLLSTLLLYSLWYCLLCG